MSIPVCSNSALIILVYRTRFWWLHLNILSHLMFTLLGVSILGLHAFTFVFTYSFYGMMNATGYTPTEHSSPLTTNNSTSCQQFAFCDNSSHPRYFQHRENCSLTFNYMVYTFSTCKKYVSIIPSTVHRESSRLTEMHKLSRTDTELLVSRYLFHVFRGHP